MFTITGGDENHRKAFLDLLMELTNDGMKFTDEELREEVDTMMIAVSIVTEDASIILLIFKNWFFVTFTVQGNDTTASVNTFAILMLASHPEIQVSFTIF